MVCSSFQMQTVIRTFLQKVSHHLLPKPWPVCLTFPYVKRIFYTFFVESIMQKTVIRQKRIFFTYCQYYLYPFYYINDLRIIEIRNILGRHIEINILIMIPVE